MCLVWKRQLKRGSTCFRLEVFLSFCEILLWRHHFRHDQVYASAEFLVSVRFCHDNIIFVMTKYALLQNLVGHFWHSKHPNWKNILKQKVVDLGMKIPIPLVCINRNLRSKVMATISWVVCFILTKFKYYPFSFFI